MWPYSSLYSYYVVWKEAEVSTQDSEVKVFVIPTNEQVAIANDTYELTKGQTSNCNASKLIGKCHAWFFIDDLQLTIDYCVTGVFCLSFFVIPTEVEESGCDCKTRSIRDQMSRLRCAGLDMT